MYVCPPDGECKAGGNTELTHEAMCTLTMLLVLCVTSTALPLLSPGSITEAVCWYIIPLSPQRASHSSGRAEDNTDMLVKGKQLEENQETNYKEICCEIEYSSTNHMFDKCTCTFHQM